MDRHAFVGRITEHTMHARRLRPRPRPGAEDMPDWLSFADTVLRRTNIGPRGAILAKCDYTLLRKSSQARLVVKSSAKKCMEI